MADLSERDRKVLVMAWQCFKEQPEVDYKQLQEMEGYKTPASATTAYCGVKKKFLGDASANLSDRDRSVLVAAWKCFKSLPQVDYKKLAEMGGYKTAASATTAYCQTKNKLLGTTSAKKDTPKRKKTVDSGDEDTPAPKKRAKKTTSDDGTPAKSKKRAKQADLIPNVSNDLGHNLTASTDSEHDTNPGPIIKREPQDELVDTALLDQAAQFLEDEKTEKNDQL